MVSTGSLGAGPRSCAADEAASAGSKSPASETTGSAVVVVPYSIVNLLLVSGAILDGIVPGWYVFGKYSKPVSGVTLV